MTTRFWSRNSFFLVFDIPVYWEGAIWQKGSLLCTVCSITAVTGLSILCGVLWGSPVSYGTYCTCTKWFLIASNICSKWLRNSCRAFVSKWPLLHTLSAHLGKIYASTLNFSQYFTSSHIQEKKGLLLLSHHMLKIKGLWSNWKVPWNN